MEHKTFYKINVEYTIKNSETNKDEVKREQLNIIALNGHKAMDLAYEIIKHKYNISSYVCCAIAGKDKIYK
jgi:hypothetical protein